MRPDQRIYLVTSIADPEHPTTAELADGIDLAAYVTEEVSFGFDGSATDPARLTVVRATRVRPAKIIDGEFTEDEPTNRADRQALEQRRSRGPQ